MTPVLPKDRHPHLGHQPPGGAHQITRRHHHERPPFPRPSRRWAAPENDRSHHSQLRQPDHKPLPISAEQCVSSPHICPADVAGEIAFNRLVAHDSIRLREVRQQTHRAPANPATKPPNPQPQNLRIHTSEIPFIVAERNQRPNLPAIRAFFRARHSGVPVRREIDLRRTPHPDDDLHSIYPSRRIRAIGNAASAKVSGSVSRAPTIADVPSACGTPSAVMKPWNPPKLRRKPMTGE